MAFPRERPSGVAVLAILQFILGVLLIMAGAFLLAGQLGDGLAEDVLATLGGLLLFMAIVGFLLGWGLWSLRPWARTIALIFACLWVIVGLLTVTIGVGIIVALLAILILWYLMRPEIKAAFDAEVSMALPFPSAAAGGGGFVDAGAARGPAYCPHCGVALLPGAQRCPSCSSAL